MAKRDLNVVVPLVGRKEHILCDLGLFLGQSFRVGWGPNWTLAHSGVTVSPTVSDSGAKKGWSQGGIFSSVPKSAVANKGHPIRVMVEQVSVNPYSKMCDSVSLEMRGQKRRRGEGEGRE
jgi:hypothetical protein